MQKLKKHGGCFYCRREIAALFLLLCGRCLAFVPGNTPTSTRHRDGRTCSVKSSITPAAKSTVAVAHRCSTRSSRLLSVLLISRSSLQSSTSRIGTKNGEAENNSRNSEDPFRSKRASLAPTIINALHRVLFHGEKAETAASLSSEQRAASDEWKLTEDERETVMNRVCGVADNLTELRFMLAAAVTRTPSIAKYGMLSDYGMGDDVDDNPLAQVNQAECLLALYMLHKEDRDREGAGEARPRIDFMDADRLEVLEGRSG